VVVAFTLYLISNLTWIGAQFACDTPSAGNEFNQSITSFFRAFLNCVIFVRLSKQQLGYVIVLFATIGRAAGNTCTVKNLDPPTSPQILRR
jgi:hypothetical protein